MKPRRAGVLVKVLGWSALAALVALVLTLLGSVMFVWWFDLPDPAKWEKARTEMGEIQKALLRYAEKNDGLYPSHLEAVAPEFPGGKLPLNPWTKQPFAYESYGRSFRLICLGKDGKPGGAVSYNLDIVYTEKGLP